MRDHDARRLLPWALLLAAAGCDAAPPADPYAADDGEHDHADAADDDADTADPAPAAWGEPRPLVTGDAWRMAAATDDPLAHERPAVVECPAAAWGPELGGVEIQTGTCSYFFATQPSLAAIDAGDAIEVVAFHDRLDAAEPAEGHVALLLEDEVVWEARVEIPAEANVLEARVVAERAWPAGATVGLHLHNHGYNAWTVLEVGVAPQQ